MSVNFDCGCKFDLIDKKDNRIEVDYDINTVRFDCSKTWDLISDGNTKGCFQLESRLGQSMAKKLKPSCIEELSALISILRPGCLEAIRDGKSVSNHYIDKKNGEESVDYFHESLEPILKNTHGEMVYQEQAMEIAKDIAGFNLQEADMLRKAIGKKKPEEMAKIKTKFIEGSVKIGKVNNQEAEQIFGWIEKSQRYSFNKSHAVSYAINGYISAHAKAHFPKIFFLSYLRLAKDKIDPQQEILELVNNAKQMDISIFGPDIRLKNKDFQIVGDSIYFGLTNIKGVGESVFIKLHDLINTIDISNCSWIWFAFSVLLNINSSASKALISSGSLGCFNKSRNSMIFEFNLLQDLTDKEIEKCLNIIQTHSLTKTTDILSMLMDQKISKNRKPKILSIINQLNNPPYDLSDNPETIVDDEKELLGISLTFSKTDLYDSHTANVECKELNLSFPPKKIFFLIAQIDNINVVVTKNGKNPGKEMCFLTLSDGSGSLDNAVMFPEEYDLYKEIIHDGRVLMFSGQKSGKNNTPVVKKCYVV